MPVVYRELELDQVLAVLYGRGYGPAFSSGYALTLNKPTGKRFSDGSAERMPLPGLSEQQLQNVLRFADDVADAANRIEKIMLGQDMMPVDNAKVNAQVQQPGLTLAEIERLLTNRVTNEVTKHTDELLKTVSSWMAEVKKELLTLFRDVAKLKEARPKMGRPLGSKNKPKAKPADDDDVEGLPPALPVDDEGGPTQHY